MKDNTRLKLLILVLIMLIIGASIMRDKLHAPGATVVPAMQPYSSEEGVSFMYPDTYNLTSAHHQVGALGWDSTDFVDKKFTQPVNGEGPTVISLSIFSNAEGLSLEDYVKTQPQSNYRFSKDKTLTKGTIGGEPSISYQFSGLYENDAVAVLHNHRVYIFSDSWGQTVDPIRQDFNKVLSSVQFN